MPTEEKPLRAAVVTAGNGPPWFMRMAANLHSGRPAVDQERGRRAAQASNASPGRRRRKGLPGGAMKRGGELTVEFLGDGMKFRLIPDGHEEMNGPKCVLG